MPPGDDRERRVAVGAASRAMSPMPSHDNVHARERRIGYALTASADDRTPLVFTDPRWRPAMPRYFFHVQDGHAMPDDTGTVCAGPVEARTEAVIASGALLRDLGARFWPQADWRMHVVDEKGGTVCDLRISGTISGASIM